MRLFLLLHVSVDCLYYCTLKHLLGNFPSLPSIFVGIALLGPHFAEDLRDGGHHGLRLEAGGHLLLGGIAVVLAEEHVARQGLLGTQLFDTFG